MTGVQTCALPILLFWQDPFENETSSEKILFIGFICLSSTIVNIDFLIFVYMSGWIESPQYFQSKNRLNSSSTNLIVFSITFIIVYDHRRSNAVNYEAMTCSFSFFLLCCFYCKSFSLLLTPPLYISVDGVIS